MGFRDYGDVSEECWDCGEESTTTRIICGEERNLCQKCAEDFDENCKELGCNHVATV